MKNLILPSIILVASSYHFPNDFWKDELRIKQYSKNPSYWQYKGKPVLLLGASDDDNLFQWTSDRLIPHLDSMIDIGANYLRNTMSDRLDKGLEIKAFKRLESGKYDLGQWNVEYWQRFKIFLDETYKRDIIVQIEVWDRFDHSTKPWLTDPYNPLNNINYTTEESGLDTIYSLHPGKNVQPFFFTVPEVNSNQVVLKYQQEFVRKLLSISLDYGNVLYCIDNETKGVEEWAVYWAEFIKSVAGDRDVNVTQMWDTWDVKTPIHKRTLDHPERYDFIDISQNSQLPGYENWENAQYVFDYIKDNTRPVNSTKIYGNDGYERWLFRGMTTEHAVQTFYRNIIGGFASSRFHRPTHGLGLSQLSINCIQTIRNIEQEVKMWEVVPRMDLLKGADNNQAYLAAKEGEKYLIYFPANDQVLLNLEKFNSPFTLRWISAEDAIWSEPEIINGGGYLKLQPQEIENSFAILIKI